MARKFNVATAAGTFDYFHKGHESFLLAAFDLADTIYIGIASDVFAKSKRQVNGIAPFGLRKDDVEAFLKTKGLLARANVVELHDIYGPTLDPDCPIEAIIVTEKTRYGAELINKLRKQKLLPDLAIEEVSYIHAEDGADLSATRIRQGEIDRQGRLFIKPEWLERELKLTSELRAVLAKPIGQLIKGSEHNLSEAIEVIKRNISKDKPLMMVTVGDVVAKSFNEGHLPMHIAIVDYQVRRVETFKKLSEIGFSKKDPDSTVENPRGTLTPATFTAVKKAVNNVTLLQAQGKQLNNGSYIIRVIGEEDLATLAAVLVAPLGTHVYYGQPNEGIVDVVVTEEKKAEVRDIVSRFR